MYERDDLCSSPDMAFMMGDQSDIRRNMPPTRDVLVFAREDIEGQHWNATAAYPTGVSIIQGDWASEAYNLEAPWPKDLDILVCLRIISFGALVVRRESIGLTRRCRFLRIARPGSVP